MAKKKLAMADVTPETEEDAQFVHETATDQELAALGHTLESSSEHDETQHDPQFDENLDEALNAPPAQQDVDTSGEVDVTDRDNKPTVDAAKKKYIADVGVLGKQRGLGGKALVEFAKKVVEGAHGRVLTPGDAKALYESFKRGAERGGTLAEAPGVVPDAGVAFGNASTKTDKNKSFDAQVSKLRTFIKFGNGYPEEGGNQDAREVLSDAIGVHLGMMKEGENVKYTSTYAALGALCVAHLDDARGGIGMTTDEMKDFFAGREPRIKTGLDFIKMALENVEKALKGKVATDNSVGRDPVSSAYAEEARETLRHAINEIDPSGDTLKEIDDKAAALVAKAEAKAAKAEVDAVAPEEEAAA